MDIQQEQHNMERQKHLQEAIQNIQHYMNKKNMQECIEMLKEI